MLPKPLELLGLGTVLEPNVRNTTSLSVTQPAWLQKVIELSSYSAIRVSGQSLPVWHGSHHDCRNFVTQYHHHHRHHGRQCRCSVSFLPSSAMPVLFLFLIVNHLLCF
jgi:hypothetical protein